MSLYQALIDFKNGDLTRYGVDLADDESILTIGRVNEKNIGKSLVKLNFDEDDYVKMFTGDNEDNNNNYIISIVFGGRYYSSDVFVDSYWGREEFREGYIYNMFNESNTKILKNILLMIRPDLMDYQDNDWEKLKDISETLENIYGDADDIGYEYSTYYDEALIDGCREYVKNKLCNKFTNYGIIEKVCRSSYLTTVDIIIKMWDDVGFDKDGDISEMLTKFIKENGLEFDEDLYEDYYSYFDYENFDSEGFNNAANRILEKISDKLVDEYDQETLKKMQTFYNVLKKMNLSFDKWNYLPSQKYFNGNTKSLTSRYKLDGFEKDKIKILYSDAKEPGLQKFKLTLEEFYNFLFHPELF